MGEPIVLQARDLMGPHRGMRIQLIELHGIVGGYEYKIVNEPFWMEVRPEKMVIARARINQTRGE